MIDSTESKNFVIDQQNKMIEFLYKEQSKLIDQSNEKQEKLDRIFNSIAELYDIIEEGETDYNFILEELARIQGYAKTE